MNKDGLGASTMKIFVDGLAVFLGGGGVPLCNSTNSWPNAVIPGLK